MRRPPWLAWAIALALSLLFASRACARSGLPPVAREGTAAADRNLRSTTGGAWTAGAQGGGHDDAGRPARASPFRPRDRAAVASPVAGTGLRQALHDADAHSAAADVTGEVSRGRPHRATSAAPDPADTTARIQAESPPAPPGAAILDPATALRAWAILDRAPRGLASEPGATPGAATLQLSAHAERRITFRVTSDPAGALRLPRGGVVAVEPGRDFASVSFAGAAAGPAALVLTPEDAAYAACAPLRLAVDVVSSDDFPEPDLVVLAAAPDAAAPGALPAGERRILGLAGSAAGAVRVLRTGFRGFAAEATNVLIGIDDPAGVLGPLPASVTIPAGAKEPPELLRVTLRDAVGRATLTFRAGAAHSDMVVDSVAARWGPVPAVLVPVGARARVALRLTPGTRIVPSFGVRVDPAACAVADVRPEQVGPCAERFVLCVSGAAEGAVTVTVSAPARPDLVVDVGVVAPEVAVRDRRVVLLGLPRGAAGTVALAVGPGAWFVADGEVPACDVAGAGTASVTVRLRNARGDDAAGAASGDGTPPRDLVLPLRIEGTTRVLRVADGLRAPARTPYEIDVDAADR